MCERKCTDLINCVHTHTHVRSLGDCKMCERVLKRVAWTETSRKMKHIFLDTMFPENSKLHGSNRSRYVIQAIQPKTHMSGHFPPPSGHFTPPSGHFKPPRYLKQPNQYHLNQSQYVVEAIQPKTHMSGHFTPTSGHFTPPSGHFEPPWTPKTQTNNIPITPSTLLRLFSWKHQCRSISHPLRFISHLKFQGGYEMAWTPQTVKMSKIKFFSVK